MSTLLRQLPALATVGVGSLPFSDPALAARHAARAYDVPFCPQLPALDGDMVHEWLGADPAGCGWAAGRDRQLPHGWEAMLAQVGGAPPTHGVVKLQITGPLTLAAGLERAGGRPGCSSAVVELATELAAWLAANTRPQVEAIRALGLAALVVIDEPGLGLLGAGAEVEHVWDPVRAVAPAWGLHVCGPVPWALVAAAQPDLLSFDLVRHPLRQEARRVLAARLLAGKRVALGILDPSAPDGAPAATARTLAALTSLGRATGCAEGEIAEAVLLTPSCGSGRLPAAGERLIAAQLGCAAIAARAALDAPRGAVVENGGASPHNASGTPESGHRADALAGPHGDQRDPPPNQHTGGR